MLRTCTTVRTVGRRLWWSITPLIALAGLAGSYVLLGTANAVAFAGLTAFLSATTGWVLRSQTPGPRRVPPLPVLGVLGAAGGLAVLGLVLVAGPLGLAIAAALGATGRLVLREPRADAEVGDADRPRVEAPRLVMPALEQLPPDPLPPLSTLGTLDTPELCRTWQLTYPRLRRATSPAEIEHLTALRLGCLAQLERRDPVAFGRWLPTARAASDPARYFCRPSPRVSRDVAP